MTSTEPSRKTTSEVTVFLFTPLEAFNCLTYRRRFSVSGVQAKNHLAGVSCTSPSAAWLNFASKLCGVALPVSDSNSLRTSDSFLPESKISALRFA